jgi:hypothetical protein
VKSLIGVPLATWLNGTIGARIPHSPFILPRFFPKENGTLQLLQTAANYGTSATYLSEVATANRTILLQLPICNAFGTQKQLP